jgi:hypothetical protein|tara:strand:+ start:127 stop:435 length:309 start_codon:yes stop_codon:yes gene_type:complete
MMGEILLKVHKSYRFVVAVCDKELLGKKFVDGKRQLDLTGEFFKGEEFGLDEASEKICKLVEEDATFNVIGNKSVKIMKDLEIIRDEGILKVSGVPFALVLL